MIRLSSDTLKCSRCLGDRLPEYLRVAFRPNVWGTSHVLHTPPFPMPHPWPKLLCSHCKQPNQLTQTVCQPQLNDSLLVCVCVCRQIEVGECFYMTLLPFKMMSVGTKLTNSVKLLYINSCSHPEAPTKD